MSAILQLRLEYTDYYGGCPICWGNDGYRNVHEAHVFFCAAHKKCWIAGWNLMSSWQYKNEENWRRNQEVLADFELCDPAYFNEDGDFNEVALRVPGVAERAAKNITELAIAKAKRKDDPSDDEILF